MVPGIRTGMQLDEALRLMKRDGRMSENSSELVYADGDGYLTLFLKDGKIARITRNLNLC